MGLTVAGAGVAAIEPLLLKGLIDDLTAGAAPRALAYWVAFLLGAYVVREILAGFANWLHWRTRLHVQQAILDTTVGRLHSLSVAYHRANPVGSLLTRLDRGIQGVVSAFSELAFNLIPNFCFMLVSAVLMIRLDWRLALLVLLIVPLPALIGAWAAPIQTRRERVLLQRWTRIYGRFNEVLTGIVTVKSFAMEHEEKRRFVNAVAKANQVVERGVGFDSRVAVSQNLLVGLARIAVLAFGAHLVMAGSVTLGTLLAFWGYLGGLFGPVQGLTGIYQTVRRARVSLDAVFDFIDSEERVADAPDALAPERLVGRIAFDDVSFGYTPDRHVLDGFTLTIEPGETVALVGPSGSGKTTITTLLQRLYDPQQGRVRVDGFDVRDLQQQALRRQIGVVLQDAWLFDDTIAANIAYGKPDATGGEIARAAQAANASSFIDALPDRYDTRVGERGQRLSAGQRQRIAIARALLKDPPIVILDEATSALDVESEYAVQEALRRLLAGRTTVIIAHRLSTIVKADRICVIKQGRIVEQGSHEMLLARAGHYAALLNLARSGAETAGALCEDVLPALGSPDAT